jgi:hypothetical protein
MLVDSFIEPEIADEMEFVEWSTLSESENQSLAVSISILHDARAEHSQASDALARSLFLAFVLISFNVIALSMNLAALSIVVGNCVAVFINALLMRVSRRVSKKMVEAHKDILLAEVRHLKRRYPKQDESV